MEKRVLIVDDEPTIANTMKLIFSKAGYSARTAYSAEEALPVVASWQPQLLILDIRLPGMNGVELAIQVKQGYPQCHVLLFTGDTGIAELMESARERGHEFEVLMKPIPPVDFLKMAAGFFPGRPTGN